MIVVLYIKIEAYTLFCSVLSGANILRGVAGAGVLAGFDKFKEVYIAWRIKQE